MSSQEPKKNVPIYFYYLTIAKQKDSSDSSTYDIQQIVDAFSKLLPYITEKGLKNKKKTFQQGIVIIKGKLNEGESVKYLCLSDNVYFGRKLKNANTKDKK